MACVRAAALAAVAVLSVAQLAVGSDVAAAEDLLLKAGSPAFERWTKPPVQPQMKVYIFNFTNSEKFLDGEEQPILHELGPYVYDMAWEREAVTFNGSSTVSFKQKKIYKFNPELSVGKETDTLNFLNVPVLSMTSYTDNGDERTANTFAALILAFQMTPVLEGSVRNLLWGYPDKLFSVLKGLAGKEAPIPYGVFDLMNGKNGTSKRETTVSTGATDISHAGEIFRFGDTPALTSDDTACSRFDGSDGSLFPPHIAKDTTLRLANMDDMCRTIPLKFLKEVKASNGVDGYRFTPPDDVLASAAQNPDTRCDCFGDYCLPGGLMDGTTCREDNTNILLSFPHFYLGDPMLRKAVSGVSEPDPEKHMLYVDVHPKTGVALGARTRLQLNLLVGRRDAIFDAPETVVPIMWYEEGFDGMPVDE